MGIAPGVRPSHRVKGGKLRIAWEGGRGTRGLLLLHGLSGTPDEVLPVARALAPYARVSVPWLPGHGTSPEDLSRFRCEDWTRAVEDAYDRLALRVKRVAVGGLSMGACLALHLALVRNVAGVVSMAAPIHIRDPRFRALGFFRFLQRRTRDLTGGVQDPKAYHKTYPWCPTDSLYEMKRLTDRLAPRLGDLTAPLLILQGRKDSMVPASNAEYLSAHAGSKAKRLVYLDHSDHVLPLDYDKTQVIREVRSFLGGRIVQENNRLR